MNNAETVNAQVKLPAELYGIIEQRAKAGGHSISGEIVAILSFLLSQPTDELEQEFAEWEAASDEDWQGMEAMLAAEAS